MNDDIAIKVEHVTKTFREQAGSRSFKEAFVNAGRRITGKKEQKIHKGDFTVLESINFEIKKGEFFGIVGRNGSGKSTLLKIIAGVYSPTKGAVSVNGKLTPFIELGVGFNPELSGRDNVYLNAALLGFTRKQTEEMYDDIVDFAELAEFMDTKLKNYSSGMQVRLAFSVAIRAESDILLIDEVLAVGDAAFQTKCFDYFHKLKSSGATVIFVSHDRTSLERFCDRGILIDDGMITNQGTIEKVLKSYSKVVLKELEHTNNHENKERLSSFVTESNYAEIDDVVLMGANNRTKSKFMFGEDIYVQYRIKVLTEITNPIFGVIIRRKNLNEPIYATNTLIEDISTNTNKAGSITTFKVKLPAMLNDGEYYVEPAVANESATVFFDHKPNAATFFVNGSKNPHSVISSSDRIFLKKAINND